MVVERDWKVSIAFPALDNDKNRIYVLSYEYELNDYTAKVLLDSFISNSDSSDVPGLVDSDYMISFYHPLRNDDGVRTFRLYEEYYMSEILSGTFQSLLSLLCDDLPNAKLLYTAKGW
jgi:hypothetical protein